MVPPDRIELSTSALPKRPRPFFGGIQSPPALRQPFGTVDFLPAWDTLGLAAVFPPSASPMLPRRGGGGQEGSRSGTKLERSKNGGEAHKTGRGRDPCGIRTRRFRLGFRAQRVRLRVKATGLKTYLIQYRNADGRTRRLVLGQHGVLTPEQARQIAVQNLAAAARGEDPSADRHAARSAPTVADLCDLYLCEGLATRKASSIASARANIENHIKPLLGPKRAAGLAPGRGGLPRPHGGHPAHLPVDGNRTPLPQDWPACGLCAWRPRRLAQRAGVSRAGCAGGRTESRVAGAHPVH
jgi:hypothetical protein